MKTVPQFDYLATSAILFDRTGTIVDMNTTAETLLGVSRTLASRQSLFDFLPQEADEIRSMIDGAHATQLTYAQDLELAPGPRRPDERIVDCRVSPTPATETENYILEMADVTRRVRLQRENGLLQQHSAGRKMISQLAHEIKNPLGGIRGAAQLLQRQLPTKELAEYTDVIISEADRLAGLVNTLLGPGARSVKASQNVHSLLEHVARLVEVEQGADFRIHREYDPGLPNLNLDRDQMIQAFLNVAVNAVQAISNDGQVTFRTRAVSNFTIGDKQHRVVASVEVIDNGPGISTDLRESIFFPLVTGREGGTGLGLPLAQELVNRHGGLIEFDSHPGHTIFYIRLPIVSPDHE